MTVPAPGSGGIVRAWRAEDPEGLAGGQLGFGPPRHGSPRGPPWPHTPGGRESGLAVLVRPAAEVGGGVWVTVPTRRPFLPRVVGEFRRPALVPAAPRAGSPGCWGAKLGQAEGLM